MPKPSPSHMSGSSTEKPSISLSFFAFLSSASRLLAARGLQMLCRRRGPTRHCELAGSCCERRDVLLLCRACNHSRGDVS